MMSGGNYTTIENQKISESVPAVSDPGHVAVKFEDSNLETFPPAEAQGKISGGSRPPRNADDTFSKPGSGSDESPPSGCFAHLQLLHINPTLMLTYRMF